MAARVSGASVSSAAVSGAAVEFADVSYRVERAPAPDQVIVDRVSFTLAPGSVTALLGRSGSGKTTLLRMANGLVRPTSGTVSVSGRPIVEGALLALRRRTGYCIQETGLFPHWTVARNVGLALELAGAEPAATTARARGMLEFVGLDPALGTRFPWQLSGGQRQRVGLARALAGDPEILLMDEPFGALDPLTRAEMQTTMRDLLGRLRTTVLLVTHDLDEACFLAERLLFVDGGRIVADVRSREVRESANDFVRRYVAAVHRADPAQAGA